MVLEYIHAMNIYRLSKRDIQPSSSWCWWWQWQWQWKWQQQCTLNRFIIFFQLDKAAFWKAIICFRFVYHSPCSLSLLWQYIIVALLGVDVPNKWKKANVRLWDRKMIWRIAKIESVRFIRHHHTTNVIIQVIFSDAFFSIDCNRNP